MEEPVKEQQPAAAIPGPLRSSTISKEERPTASDLSNSPSPRRAKAATSVSKSVRVLDLSKKKSAKPPRRLSIPTKSNTTPSPKLVGTITPISEVRTKKSRNGEGKSDTPLSDASRSAATRKGFSVLSSTSYWLRQIKLSESASKHSVSLGFFKLAFEAGCEPLQGLRNELKSYLHRHNLGENEEAINELLESYNVSENSDQPQESETCSRVLEEGTRSSDDDDDPSDSSAVGSGKLKAKPFNTDAGQVSAMTESAKKATPKNNLSTRNRVSNKNSSNSMSVLGTGSSKLQKKTRNTTKLELVKAKAKTKRQGTKSANEEGQVSPPAAVETVEKDKENAVTPLTEEISLSRVM